MSMIRMHNRFRGVLLSTDKETGKTTGRELRTCCHCQHTWIHHPGSGRLRGFCTNCAGHVCGLPACVARGCVHFERFIENIEKGLPLDFKPIIG